MRFLKIFGVLFFVVAVLKLFQNIKPDEDKGGEIISSKDSLTGSEMVHVTQQSDGKDGVIINGFFL